MKDFSQRFYRQYGKRLKTGQKDDGIRIISVQSAKGGVGKTLLSLLLGNQILELKKAIRVFLFDLDFGGTSLSDLLKRDKAKNKKDTSRARKTEEGTFLHHVPIFNLANLANEIDDKYQYNLLDLFQAHLQGVSINVPLNPRFLQKHTDKWSSSKNNRICLLPSGKFDSGGMVNGNIFFDLMHGEWFCEFLFQTIFQLYESEKDKPAVFILDNGPGWSELLPLLQCYLLRWGVHRAKFLQVASFDQMDIDASLRMLEQLYTNYLKIYYTKDYYLQSKVSGMKKNNNIINSLIDEEYFYELVGENNFNRPEDHPASLLQLLTAHRKNQTPHQISNFMGLILNKALPSNSLDALEAYINHNFENLIQAYREGLPYQGVQERMKQKPAQGRFLSALPIFAFSHETILAHIYQEAFVAKTTPDFPKPPLGGTMGLPATVATPENTQRLLRSKRFEEIPPNWDKPVWEANMKELSKNGWAGRSADELMNLLEKLFIWDTAGKKWQLSKSAFRDDFEFILKLLNSWGYSVLPHMDLRDLVLLDAINFHSFLSPKATLLQSKLINNANFEVFSHLLRASSLLFRVFSFCARCLEPLYSKNLTLILPHTDHFASLQFDLSNRFKAANAKHIHSDWLGNIASFLHETLIQAGKSYSIVGHSLDDVSTQIRGVIHRNMLDAEEDIHKSHIPNMIKEVYEFYFVIFAGAVFYLTELHERSRGKSEPPSDIAISKILNNFIEALGKLSWSLLGLAHSAPGLSKAKELYHDILARNKLGELELNVPIDLNYIYQELKAWLHSLESVEQNHHLITAIWKMFQGYTPVSTFGMLYIRNAIEELFRGNRTDTWQIKQIVDIVLTDNSNVPSENKYLINTTRMESDLKELLNEWGIK